MTPVIVDIDDLFDEEQIKRWLLPLKEEVPELMLTCYSIPNKLGPVHELKEKYPWVIFAQHGWEHTHFECRSWTRDQAYELIDKAIDWGYERIFKPPNWVFDVETELACRDLDVVLHHHVDDEPTVEGLWSFPGTKIQRTSGYLNLHTHIQKSPATDHISTHPGFRARNLCGLPSFAGIRPFALKVTTQ